MNRSIQAFAFAAATLSLTIFSSCRFSCIKGSGHEVTENRKVADFNKIDISGGFRVILHQDSSLNVNLTGDDNLLKYVQMGVEGGRLRIHNRKNICSSREMVLNIGVRKLEGVKTAGAIDMQNQGTLNVQDIDLDFSGASTVTMNLNAANVHTEGSGSTEIHLSGQATSHKIDLSGSGHLYAYNFVTGTYNIITSGASYCEINVLKALKVNTSGASDIKYKGSPADVSSEKSGASSVTKVD